MYKMGIIEESLLHKEVLNQWKNYFYSQRVEEVHDDAEPCWHVSELHIPDFEITKIAETLIYEIKDTWYIHAFNEHILYVFLKNKYFVLPLLKNEEWKEMIEYGIRVANVQLFYLESISDTI